LLRNLWVKFRELKVWQKSAIVIGLIFFGLASSASESTTSPKEAKSIPSVSPSATPMESISPSETPSPTPTESPTPESPIEFRFSALRDLTDMRKDLNDARIGITENGLGKFYWNLAEIKFNLVQLETLSPRDEYAVRWNQKLEILKAAVTDLGAGEDDLTISKAKSQLNRVLNAIPALESIARSLAN
jgi:hypothetical protein